MHHGTNDTTVPLAQDQLLDTTLAMNGINRQLHVYSGYGHNDIRFDSLMYARTLAWFQAYGCTTVTSSPENDTEEKLTILPNPSSGIFRLTGPAELSVVCFDLNGRQVAARHLAPASQALDLSEQKAGIYVLRISAGNKTFTRKVVRLP